MFDIAPLRDRKHLIEVCAAWDFARWGCLRPKHPFADVLALYGRSAADDRLPVSWVAECGGRPAGMVTLDLDDHPDCRHLSPWLSSLYVHPVFRERGLARALCERVLARAAELQVPALYLYTAGAEPLYRGMGWRPIGIVAGPTGLDETLMARPIAP